MGMLFWGCEGLGAQCCFQFSDLLKVLGADFCMLLAQGFGVRKGATGSVHGRHAAGANFGPQDATHGSTILLVNLNSLNFSFLRPRTKHPTLNNSLGLYYNKT